MYYNSAIIINRSTCAVLTDVIGALVEGVEKDHHHVETEGKVERDTGPQTHVTSYLILDHSI